MQKAWHTPLSGAFRLALDYALPPRCPSCGEIVLEDGGFCAPCWSGLAFIAAPHCAICGDALPDLAEDGAQCARCLADPPPFAMMRAVAWHQGAARTLVHRLKYGRRTGHARIMARHMARLLPDNAGNALLVPVPLHRWRIWSRGFNQSAMIARALSRSSGARPALDVLLRTRRTPPLYSLGRSARQRAVQGAFALRSGAAAQINGQHIILIDDVWTTGATATNCAHVLMRAGASRVDIICWSRTPADQAD